MVRKAVSLFEILSGEEDRSASGDQPIDLCPHVRPAPGVKARRRLVEHQHRRFCYQAGRKIEPASHAARVSLGDPVRRFDEVELLQ